MRVLVLGADGFIGRHIACHLRDEGHEVLASARRPNRLAAMGFTTLRADLTDPATHDPAFWAPHLPPETHLVNAAGLLTGSHQTFESVHISAPRAAMAALQGHAVLISAIGIEADTPFAHWRREGEAVAQTAQATILRPGLVLGETSYGGSSLLRALAALPFVMPVVGRGDQPFNPIHATDLARIVAHCLTHPPGPGLWEVGGPETLSQTALTALIRRWMGLPEVPVLHLPLPLVRGLGRIGDALRLGPISATSVAQLERGIHAKNLQWLHNSGLAPRATTTFLQTRPAGTQDLWHARIYLLKPLIRLTLAAMWLASGLLGLLLPAAAFAPALSTLPSDVAIPLARVGGVIDLALALALIRNWRPPQVALAQLAMVLGYTIGLNLIAPGLWLDPFGGLLKNLPILALILTHIALAEER